MEKKSPKAYGLEAKIELEKDEISMCGRLGMDTKLTGYNGTGSEKMYKMNS